MSFPRVIYVAALDENDLDIFVVPFDIPLEDPRNFAFYGHHCDFLYETGFLQLNRIEYGVLNIKH